jgi:hypothetical protein
MIIIGRPLVKETFDLQPKFPYSMFRRYMTLLMITEFSRANMGAMQHPLHFSYWDGPRITSASWSFMVLALVTAVTIPCQLPTR